MDATIASRGRNMFAETVSIHSVVSYAGVMRPCCRDAPIDFVGDLPLPIVRRC